MNVSVTITRPGSMLHLSKITIMLSSLYTFATVNVLSMLLKIRLFAFISHGDRRVVLFPPGSPNFKHVTISHLSQQCKLL
jgi:hypothetical protein